MFAFSRVSSTTTVPVFRGRALAVPACRKRQGGKSALCQPRRARCTALFSRFRQSGDEAGVYAAQGGRDDYDKDDVEMYVVSVKFKKAQLKIFCYLARGGDVDEMRGDGVNMANLSKI